MTWLENFLSRLRLIFTPSDAGQSTTTPTEEPVQYKEQVALSPNRQPDWPNKCAYLVLHHTDGWSKTGDINAGDVGHCRNPATKVSYHCIIAWDGTRTILAKDEDRAWHAGESIWQGRRDCNSFTIGLAFGGNTNTGQMRPNGSRVLTKAELESAVQFIVPRMKKYGWTVNSIITHQMISPGRKTDTSSAVLAQIRDAVSKVMQ